MKINLRLLKAKMILYGDTNFIEALSTLFGISRQTASAKLSGESEWTRIQIALFSKHYGLTDEEIRIIFVEGDGNDESERSSKDVR